MRPPSTLYLARLSSVIALAAGAAFGLLHRYIATDGVAWHIDALRTSSRAGDEDDTARKRRQCAWRLKVAFRFLLSSAWSVVAGAVLTGLGFGYRFLFPIEPATAAKPYLVGVSYGGLKLAAATVGSIWIWFAAMELYKHWHARAPTRSSP